LAKQLFQLFIVNDEAYGVEDQAGWRTERGKLTIEELKGLKLYPRETYEDVVRS
jgi:hypothetical protein